MGGVARFGQWLKLHGCKRIVDSGSMTQRIPLSFALLLLAGCAAEAPPELEGLWSRSDGACAMGAGVRFEAEAVRVFLGRDEQILFEAPRYRVERRGRETRITIDYGAPARSGDASGRQERGTLILERGSDDWIRPVSHEFADKTTGAVHMRLGEEDVSRFFILRRCPGASADSR